MATDALPLVLLVEDDQGVRRPLEKFLEMNHFKVVTAETADEAIDYGMVTSVIRDPRDIPRD